MQLTRRNFLRASATLGGATASFNLMAASGAPRRPEKPWKLHNTQEYVNICCYCSGGCGTICSVRDGHLINLEGDPDHPCNLGGLCPKGAGMAGFRHIVTKDRRLVSHPHRLTRPKVRRPFSTEWEEISWAQAIDEIAHKIKKTRDENYIKEENGVTVNRCDGFATFGAAQLNNEEGWLLQKMTRALGSTQIDNQTRVCHSSTVAGLAPSFGRGSMTSHWSDFQNADVILTIGSNNVECHPLSSRWVHRAVDRGGKWIVVDPRFTRSAAQADIYSPIRPGTDIAFFGGLVYYIISKGLYQKEYIENYTNATYLLNKDYSFDVATGLFSGWNEKEASYSNKTWAYQVDHVEEWNTAPGGKYDWVKQPGVPEFKTPAHKVPKKDPTMQDPMCVLNVMKRHYSRYTIENVCKVTGQDPEVLELVYKTYAETGKPGKAGSILYALGQTQHHYGSQNCRAMCVVQLLLGNIGIAGGGINALRGEPNVQGSTDVACSSPDLPGYLAWPQTKHKTLADYLAMETYSDGYYTNKPKFMVSFLKEYFGENATVENDYLFDLLPKRNLKYNDTTMATFHHMDANRCKGYLVWGMNPCHSAANTKFVRQAMSHLDWLVVADWFETETASFWYAPDMDPTKIGTSVYMLPAALIYEKEGSINNSGRWLQWRQKAVEPMGQAKSDFEMIALIFSRIQELYRAEGGVNPDQVLKVNWNYRNPAGQWDVKTISHAMNGYDCKTGKLVPGYGALKADGSTACGIWIFSGFYNNNAARWDPMAQPCTRRSKKDPGGLGLYPEWSYAWPNNRRVLYNRASADAKGQPWRKDRMLVQWDGKKWVCNDVPDFTTAVKGEDGKMRPATPSEATAFFMTWEQTSRLFSYLMKDGPMPEHFEPFESPTKNLLHQGHDSSPCMLFADHKSAARGDASKYPIIATSYSLVEHWQSGTQTRNVPWILETQPAAFIEVSRELAADKCFKNGD
ncbi:MAG: molybdopterin-dependent oxidoreductase, partial [Duodenibacillus sp.]|nr:molybdopterin-dependent oxidoreductase [Duodenibacillus sp.]